MPSETPPFRIWLRRTSGASPTFALRFEAFDGKGVLRVARPGVLVDPPARVSGYEAEISLGSVRASRFLHVSTLHRKRDTWFMSRLAEDQLETLPLDSWAELSAVVDRGARHLVLAPQEVEELVPLMPEPELGPEPPSEHDEFQPHEAIEHIPHLPDTLEPVFAEDLVPLETEEAPDTDEEEEDAYGDPVSEESAVALLDEDQDVTEITRGVLEAGLAQIALQAAEPAPPVVQAPAAPAVTPAPVAAPAPAAPVAAAPAEASPAEAPPDARGPISPNGLVRHLRRQLTTAHLEIAALNARIAMLERRLAAGEFTPMAMDSDTDEA